MAFSADLAARALALGLADVAPSALAVAKATLLDTLAVALAARSERVVSAVTGFIADETREGPCTIWATLGRAGPARAALANGTAAHALDFDDVCWAMNAHPSAVLWPTVLAVAESVGASGAAALLGYVAGFEAEAEIGALLGRSHYAAGFHPTSTIGTLGAAVSAGKILGLDEPSLLRAIGIACSEAAGSRMNFGTDTKPLHAGLAAQAGVTAALLAARGVTAREDGIEAPMGLVALYAGEGKGAVRRRELALLDPGVELKPYPSCRFTHRVIDAVLALRERRGTRDLTALACSVDPFAERIVIYPRPRNGLEAKFSMQYCAAVAWLDGWPTLAAFADDRASAPDVQHLLARVVVEPGSPEAETVTARYRDGSTDSETVRVAKGSPSHPLTDAERLAKVRACAARAPGVDIELLARAVEGMDAMPDVRALGPLLGAPRRSDDG